MTYTKPDEEDFVTEDSKVTHKPTGAWCSYYHNADGGFSFAGNFAGTTDRPSPDGVNYSFDELQAMAWKLFKAKHYRRRT